MDEVPEQASEALVIPEEQAAKLLMISKRTLQKWRVEGRGPAFTKLGKRVFYTRAALVEEVRRCQRRSTASSSPEAA